MPRVIAIWQGGSGAPVRSDRFVTVVDLMHQRGMHGQHVLTPPVATMEEAERIRKDLYLAARYYCSCGERLCTKKYDNLSGCPDGGTRLSIRADVVRDKKRRLRVQLRLFDKTAGIRSVVERYGPDPSLWPYQARAKKERA